MKISHDSETPAHGQQVITATALIWHDFDGTMKVFLPKRAATKKFLPDVYELPGGHIDFGEDIVDGLKREIKEELGMTIRVGDPFAAHSYINDVKGSHSIEVVYFAQFVESIEQVKIQPEDHSQFDWFTRSELRARQAELRPTDQALHQNGDQDAEYNAILKGFDLLSGQSPDFANSKY